jgi:hypothetical protein
MQVSAGGRRKGCAPTAPPGGARGTSGGGIDINLHNITDRRYFVTATGAGALVGELRSAFVTLHAGF